MPLRTVKLVKGARDMAATMGVNVGFLQSDEQYDREVNDKGEANVTNRDYHLLKAHGLIEEDSTRLVAPAADQPEAENAADVSRTHTDERGQSGFSSMAPPGGAGHIDGEGWNNRRIQEDIQAESERAAAARAEAGQGPVTDDELDENLRREGRLPKNRAKKLAKDEKAARDEKDARPRDESRPEAKDSKSNRDDEKVGAVRDDHPKSGDRKDQRTGQNPSKGGGAAPTKKE